MSGRENAEKALRWREILRRQADSGVSIRKFCATERISEPSFYAWRKKLRGAAHDSRHAPTASRRRPSNSANGPLFVPVKLLDAVAALEIIHPLGYRIQVNGSVNPVVLRHVLETLEERGAR